MGWAGAATRGITDALYAMRPEWRQERELVEDLLVIALYLEAGGEAVCLLTYDVCELRRKEVPPLKAAVGARLGISPGRVHAYCTHTHASSIDDSEHDMDILCGRSADAAGEAKEAASPVAEIEFLRVDAGNAFNINRRTASSPFGAWCLMQSRGCEDNGTAVDGTQWARSRLLQWGAREQDASSLEGPFLATRGNDPFLDLILFPSSGGGHAAGLVRFNAHAVVCSAGFWKPNLSRDYPGALCERLAGEFGCPFLFIQGPCGDHRPRHRANGLEERDRIANGLADAALAHLGEIRRFPFTRLSHAHEIVNVPLNARLPHAAEDARRLANEALARRDGLPPGPDTLIERKRLSEEMAFHANAETVLRGESYLTVEEGEQRAAPFTVSRVSFGEVHLLNYPGELFSTVVAGLAHPSGDPLVLGSFADGVTGYLMPPGTQEEGGYESTWALFDPAAVANLREVGRALL